nr:hypothetical protein [Burkholderia ambifaria]
MIHKTHAINAINAQLVAMEPGVLLLALVDDAARVWQGEQPRAMDGWRAAQQRTCEPARHLAPEPRAQASRSGACTRRTLAVTAMFTKRTLFATARDTAMRTTRIAPAPRSCLPASMRTGPKFPAQHSHYRAVTMRVWDRLSHQRQLNTLRPVLPIAAIGIH